jgi:hypothetical protein
VVNIKTPLAALIGDDITGIRARLAQVVLPADHLAEIPAKWLFDNNRTTSPTEEWFSGG